MRIVKFQPKGSLTKGTNNYTNFRSERKLTLINYIMPYAAFESHLKKIGLSDKEAAVYIASMQLGPQTVQNISRKSQVARATTYLVLESLMKKGLISRYEERGKPIFIAEAPHQLERLINDREQQIAKDKEELKELLPLLQAFMMTEDQRPLVRYYEGVEGLRALRSEITRQSNTEDTWYQIVPVDLVKGMFGDENFTHASTRKAKGIKSKAIIVTTSEKLRKKLTESADKWAQRKFIDAKFYSSPAGVVLLKDKVAFGTYTGRVGGVIIESEPIARMLRESFDLLWKSLA